MLSLRVTPYMKTALAELADRRAMSVGEYLARLLSDHLSTAATGT